jgi:hypothetical protein
MRLLPASTKLLWVLLLLGCLASLTDCMLCRGMLLTLMDRARGLLTGATAFLQTQETAQQHKGLQLLLHHTPDERQQACHQVLLEVYAHNAVINDCRRCLKATTDCCGRVHPDLTWLPALGQCAAPGLLAAADVRAS